MSQLRSTSPAPTRVGTRPEAIAPVAAPRKNGVTTEERAKAAPKSRRSAGSVTDLRKAKAEPRRMTPKATAVSGTESVAMIAANAEGNAVHTTTRAKMSQTWLASHTGPIECSMRARWRAPDSAPPATRSQSPAPKSAPPKST